MEANMALNQTDLSLKANIEVFFHKNKKCTYKLDLKISAVGNGYKNKFIFYQKD
jgi:hypothetical protein